MEFTICVDMDGELAKLLQTACLNVYFVKFLFFSGSALLLF